MASEAGNDVMKAILNYILCCLLNAEFWMACWRTGFPCSLPCCLFPVQCPSLLEVQTDLAMFPVFPVEEEISLALHIQNLPQHTQHELCHVL